MSSIEFSLPVHGGDIERIAERHGVNAMELLDFSVNVNPCGAPPAVLELLADRDALARALASYPDRDAAPLKRALSERYNVPRGAIVVANGSAALIDAALRSLAPTCCLVPVPAFSEYRRAIVASGHTWKPIALASAEDFRLDVRRTIDELLRVRPGVLILTNPHNPSGALCKREPLLEIVRAASAVQCMLLLDEAFIDYAPRESLAAEAVNFDNLIVLRSLTKFYGMPAMRVGYAVATPQIVRNVEAFLPSWPVSAIALDAAVRAISDPLFEKRSLARNAASKHDFVQSLREIGVRVVPSAANFLLLELPDSWGARELVCERLVRSWGIVVRDCGDYDGLADRNFVRVGIKTSKSNERIVQAFRSISKKGK